MPRFAAIIYKVGINPCVDIPATISRSFGRRGFVPVKATLGRKVFQANLVPVGGGRHRLCLNLLMRQAAGRDTGARVVVKLALDLASRTLATPADLARALRAAGVMKNFLADPPSHRKEIIRWVVAPKNAATRRRHIDLAVAHFKKRGRSVAARINRR